MNFTAKRFLLIISFLMIITSSCSLPGSTRGFADYNLKDDDFFELYKDRIPCTFSLKYPQEWETGWSSDAGIAYFYIESTLSSAGAAQGLEYTGIYITIDESEVDEGRSALELLKDGIGEKVYYELPKATRINGHDAAQAIYEWDDDVIIETYIVEGRSILYISAILPQEFDEEIRPIIKSVIRTIQIENINRE